MNSGAIGASALFRIFGFCTWLLNAVLTRDLFSKSARAQILLIGLSALLFVYVFWKSIESLVEFVVRCLVTTAATIGSFYIVQQATRELADNVLFQEVILQAKLLSASVIDLWNQYEAESHSGDARVGPGK